jgi:hypothetical protein
VNLLYCKDRSGLKRGANAFGRQACDEVVDNTATET